MRATTTSAAGPRLPFDHLVARLDAVPASVSRAPLVVAWQVVRLAAVLAETGTAVSVNADALRGAADAIRRWVDGQSVSRSLRRAAVRACDAIADGDRLLASAALESLRLETRDLLDAPSHAELADVAYRLRESGRPA